MHCGVLCFFFCVVYILDFTVDFSFHFLLVFYQGIKCFNLFIQPHSNADLHQDYLLSWLKKIPCHSDIPISTFLHEKKARKMKLGQVNFLYPYFPVQYKACNYERHAALARFPVSWGCIFVLHCLCCASGQNWKQPVNFLRDPFLKFYPLLLFS